MIIDSEAFHTVSYSVYRKSINSYGELEIWYSITVDITTYETYTTSLLFMYFLISTLMRKVIWYLRISYE